MSGFSSDFGRRGKPLRMLVVYVLLALVLMDHALRHRAQNADVRVHTPNIERR